MKARWARKTLGEVCEIASTLVDPKTPRTRDLLHVGGANIQSATGALCNLKTAKEEGLKSGKYLFNTSTVLYSKIRPYLRKVALPDFEGLCSADIYPLRPDRSCLDRKYLFYLLLSDQFTEYAISGSARAGMPKVNREHLFAFSTTLPPLPEQNRIVGLLDKTFKNVAIAMRNTEQKLIAFDELRASILEHAILGKM